MGRCGSLEGGHGWRPWEEESSTTKNTKDTKEGTKSRIVAETQFVAMAVGRFFFLVCFVILVIFVFDLFALVGCAVSVGAGLPRITLR